MRHTPETKAKLSAMRVGERNPMFGRKHTPEALAKIGAAARSHNSHRQYELSPRTVRIPQGIDLGYFAGLVDGEGSIRFAAARPFVAVYNNETAVFDWIAEHVGGPPAASYDKRGRVPAYVWRVSRARDVWALCAALLPILIVKRGDAATALAYLEQKYGEVVAGG